MKKYIRHNNRHNHALNLNKLLLLYLHSISSKSTLKIQCLKLKTSKA